MQWLIVLAAWTSTALAQAPGKELIGSLVTKEFGGKISLGIPDNFVAMPDAELAQKYPSTKKPLAVYTNAGRTADLGVNKGKTFWSDKDLGMVKDFYKANILNLYAKVSFQKEAVVTVKGKQFVDLVFVGEIESFTKARQRKWVYLRYAVVKNRLYIVQFNCPHQDQVLYEKEVKKIMDSIRIKKQKDAPDAIEQINAIPGNPAGQDSKIKDYPSKKKENDSPRK